MGRREGSRARAASSGSSGRQLSAGRWGRIDVVTDATERATGEARRPIDGRALALISTLGAVGFIVAMVIAAWLYPGGTWARPRAIGHSLWGNYLCDLMQLRARNGAPTPVGSLVARVGTVLMFAAIASFYVQVARLERAASWLARVTVGFGLPGSAIGCVIPLTPSDQFPVAHAVVVVSAFLPSFVAVLGAAVICLRTATTTRAVKLMALVTLIFGGLDGLLYILAYVSFWLGYLPPRDVQLKINDLLPALQRVGTIGMVAWVLAVARARAETSGAKV